ncbi:MAG TPA: hypothetical protein QF624_02725 [Dehalococcoidia bacterium]|nr:hypothetical protein [Dehalococcoidia bacterium]
MSALLRLSLIAGALLIGYMLLYSPGRLQALGRRLRIVGFAYVAAILIGAALRLLGFYGT